MWIPLAARVKARLPKQGFPRLADWPFAFKMGMLPAISIATLIATISIAASTLDQQAKLVDAVVQQNMAMIQHLSDSATRLQHVDAGLYRVLTLQAAHSAEQPVADDIAVLLSVAGQRPARPDGYRGSLTDPDQLKRVDAMASDLQTYRGAIEVVGSILELDFTSAVALIRPFDGNTRATLSALSGLVDDAMRDASTRAALSARVAKTSRNGFAAIAMSCHCVSPGLLC